MCLYSVNMFIWHCYEQETQHVAWPEALADTRAPIGCQESGYVKGMEKEFLFETRKHIFLGMHGLRFLSEAPWEIVIFVYILFHVYFILIFLCYWVFLFFI